MDQFHIIKLIWSRISGRLNNEQSKVLDDWLAHSKSRQIWYSRFFKETTIGEELTKMQRFNSEQGWNNIEKRISPKISGSNWRLRATAIAAVAVILLAVGTTVYLFQTSDSTVFVSENRHPVLPGEFNAILTIGEEQQIILQDSVNEVIQEQSQAVANVQNGSLAYLADASVEPLQMTVVVPHRSEYSFVLSDGTELWMNAGSKAVFKQPFSGETRDVYIEGEAYFKVAKDKAKPFIVDVCGINRIEVLGTEFNVNAYLEEVKQYSVLVEGSILWRTDEGRERLMEPGQLLQYDTADESIRLEDVDVTPYIAWKEGYFVFDGARLEHIMSALARWYGITVVYEQADLKDMPFTIDVERYDSLSTILELLQLTKKVQFSVNGTELRVKKYK